jgi:integrase
VKSACGGTLPFQAGGDTGALRPAPQRRCRTPVEQDEEGPAQARRPEGPALAPHARVGGPGRAARSAALDAHNVRRAFRRVVKAAGLDPAAWTPRELRHSFVSLLSDAGVPLENISRLVGHSGSTVTELVYRKQIRPVIADGAEAMDRIFAQPEDPKKPGTGAGA